MKISRVVIFQALLLLVFTSICLAQQNSSETYVESWDTDHLREQSFKFELNSTQSEHSEFIKRWNGSGYKLILRKVPAGKEDYQPEYWVVTLQEILSDSNSKKEKLGCNLLSTDGCGSGGDYIGDSRAGILFPREQKEVFDGLRNIPFHPIYVKRIVKVKSFYVIIKVLKYKMSESAPKKIDEMSVNVDFTNKL